MKLFAKKPAFTKKQIRNAKPLRNPALQYDEQEDGSTTLRVPITHSRAPARILAKATGASPEREVELEPVGAFVWKRCDGRHTVASISTELQQSFGLTSLEAEASLMAFLDTLARRRYISLEFTTKK